MLKGELKAKINYFFFLKAKGMNINVLSLFCTYWPAFPLKIILFAAFVAKELRLRITLSAVIFVTYDVWYGERTRDKSKVL